LDARPTQELVGAAVVRQDGCGESGLHETVLCGSCNSCSRRAGVEKRVGRYKASDWTVQQRLLARSYVLLIRACYL
jgi:hypothetical protein